MATEVRVSVFKLEDPLLTSKHCIHYIPKSKRSIAVQEIRKQWTQSWSWATEALATSERDIQRWLRKTRDWGRNVERHKLLQREAAQPKYTRHQRANMMRWAKGLMAMHATNDGSHQAMAIASTTGTITRRAVNFDTDSGPLGVDNRCLKCMSSQREGFADNLVVVKYNVKGVGGTRVLGMIGTMNFTCQDDNGMIHRHRIPGSHFAPGLEARLFSPQQFAQSKGDTHPLPRGTKESTYEDCVVLQ